MSDSIYDGFPIYYKTFNILNKEEIEKCIEESESYMARTYSVAKLNDRKCVGRYYFSPISKLFTKSNYIDDISDE